MSYPQNDQPQPSSLSEKAKNVAIFVTAPIQAIAFLGYAGFLAIRSKITGKPMPNIFE